MPESTKPQTHKQLSLTLAVHQRVIARAEATGLTPEARRTGPASGRAGLAGLRAPRSAPAVQPGRAK